MSARTTTDETRHGVTSRLTRYDAHLVAIPLVLGVSILAHVLVGLALQPTLVLASLVSTGVIVDAMFLNPPPRRRGAV